jgi:hypothetical protein
MDPVLTVLSSVEEIVGTFSQSVSYTEFDSILNITVPATITQVTPSYQDPGIDINVTNGTVTISGSYLQAFVNKTWNYIPKGETPTEIIQGVLYNQIPQEIEALITYSPDSTVSRLVTYTVQTATESAVIEQTITNNWDIGKAQLYVVLDREST